jgi:hypothetical protein
VARDPGGTAPRLTGAPADRSAAGSRHGASAAAVTGHTHKSILAIVERYGRRTRKMARLAFEKRLAAEAPPATAAEQGTSVQQN